MLRTFIFNMTNLNNNNNFKFMQLVLTSYYLSMRVFHVNYNGILLHIVNARQTCLCGCT